MGNEVVEANDFIKKLMDLKIGSDTQLFHLNRTYDPPHCEYCYTAGIKTKGQEFYIRMFRPPGYSKTFNTVLQNIKESKEEIIKVMQNGREKELLKITKESIVVKYSEDDFFAKMRVEGKWSNVLEEIEKYIKEQTKGSNMQRYSDCVKNFKTYLLKKENNASGAR